MRVLITGANRGIGAGLAATYLAAGHEVIGTARDTSLQLQLDVTDPASQEAMALSLGDSAIDLLVCNAGVYLDKGDDLDAGYEVGKWEQTFAANVTGVFLTVQTLLPLLRRAGSSRIAILSSQMASHTLAKGNSLIYRASKAAVLNLGSNLATALKPEGIAVGSYHPGWVQTDMGGSTAAITVDEAVAGLYKRFETLDLESTGCFQTWDGRDHPL